jgi:hypothetical protein
VSNARFEKKKKKKMGKNCAEKKDFFSFSTRADAESVPNAARRRGAHTQQRVRAVPPRADARRGPAECRKKKKKKKKKQ